MTIGSKLGSRRLFGVVTAAAALAAAAATGAPATALPSQGTPTVTQQTLSSGITARTSSTGHKLYVQLTASQFDQPDPTTGAPTPQSASLQVALANNKLLYNGERHSWEFPIPTSALTFNSDGSGSLDVPSANVSPYGVVSLTFSPNGTPVTVNCGGSPASSTQPVTLHGTFFFDSRSAGTHRWGSIGSKTMSFAFSAPSEVTTTYQNYSCSNFPKPPCAEYVNWETSQTTYPTSTSTGNISLNGYGSGKSYSSVSAYRLVPLSTPANSQRSDQALGHAKPLTLTTKSKTVSLSVVGANGTPGTASLSSSTKEGSFPEPCKGGTGKETVTTWDRATYRNGRSPLRVPEQIFGAISVANNKTAQITFTKG
jgi:hypothetical protein